LCLLRHMAKTARIRLCEQGGRNRNVYIKDVTYYWFAASQSYYDGVAARLIRVGPWLSQAERRTLNPHVKGSNPFGPAISIVLLSFYHCALALGDLRAKPAVGPLAARLNDPVTNVRNTAASSLRNIGGED
jgi:hypothetical protein